MSGPFSAKSTDQVVDYQGTLPSYAKVCVNLGTGSGQRSERVLKTTLTVSSTMKSYGAPLTVTLPILYAPSISTVYLPAVSQAMSLSGQ